MLEKDSALGRFQAILPQLFPQIEHPNPALAEMRMKYFQHLQSATDYVKTTRILEAISCLATESFPLSLPEILLFMGFISRFTRMPVKCEDSSFAAKRLGIQFHIAS